MLEAIPGIVTAVQYHIEELEGEVTRKKISLNDLDEQIKNLEDQKRYTQIRIDRLISIIDKLKA